jgi:hypothetical protein
VSADWDTWDLVAFFHYELPDRDAAGSGDLIARFSLPLDRLGLDPKENYWAHEFWSGQFLGTVPRPPRPPGAYTHPGDAQALVSGADGTLVISFFGPAVKLLVLRRTRPHPWVAGTRFHQSGGTELRGVAWDPASRRLRGELHRPPGQQGWLVLAGCATRPEASVAGRPVGVHPGANGAWLLPITTEAEVTPWEVMA